MLFKATFLRILEQRLEWVWNFRISTAIAIATADEFQMPKYIPCIPELVLEYMLGRSHIQ